MLVSALVTFLVVILILYLINMLPIDGRAKQIAPRRRHHPRRDLAVEIHRGVLATICPATSFRDGAKNQTSDAQLRIGNLEIPGSMLRIAPE